MGGDGDGIVGRVQGEEFDAVVLPGVFGDGFGGVVFFHGEAAAAFRVAHPASLRYAVANSDLRGSNAGRMKEGLEHAINFLI
jgi:GGDEF domain-containing protein